MTFVHNKLILQSESLPNKILNTNTLTLVKAKGIGNVVFEFSMNELSEQKSQKSVYVCVVLQ
jgi:hypothetical protein